ncbi:DUF6508 domain-containing protein [uncultured Cocleimonas sp.]|uniref:DUF6508 domain-containing protein n=1 Tax=uncultured Cocleimonas sp. TaxID=1051587 RepID=UPI002606BA79|nr:DUF6508 domain-containing protein [uncultured Cocleimonas sp.]
METINPTLEDFEEIIAFYPTLNRRDFDPIIEWKGGDKIEDNVNFMRWPIYDPVVKEFLKVADKECWRDHHFNQYVVSKMITSDVVVQCADLPQIKQMISFCVRGDKFMSEGYLGSMIKDGHVSRLLKRLDKLKNLDM